MHTSFTLISHMKHHQNIAQIITLAQINVLTLNKISSLTHINF